MEAESSNLKILITTKIANYNGHFLNFKSIQATYDWNVCYFLLKYYYSKIFRKEDESFIKEFQDFKIIDPDTDDEVVIDFSQNTFIDDPDFVEQIVNNPDLYKHFIALLKKSSFLQNTLLQNNDGSIWVLPTINDSYKEDNVLYIESIIRWSRKNNEDLYLLIHDKDIYNTIDSIRHHKVTKNEQALSTCIRKDSQLMNLIESEKVYVFIHNSDEDSYFKNIINSNNLSEKKVSEIIDHLVYVYNNCHLSEELGKELQLEKIQSILNKSNRSCDFSKKFLE